MRPVLLRVLCVAAAILPLKAGVAEAAILIDIDLSRQQMTVHVGEKLAHTWAVSSARSGYVTPTGSYTPQRMHKIWYSRKYDDAPMPHAIFYSGGFAIHGTTSTGMLGRPASHGCVRLAPGNAATLYGLVQQEGMAATRIVIHGTPPKSAPPPVAQRTLPQGQRPIMVYAPQEGLLFELFGWSQPASAAYSRIPTGQKSYLGVQTLPRSVRGASFRPR
jgi:hypothetical protein